jgi:hypothetical protein
MSIMELGVLGVVSDNSGQQASKKSRRSYVGSARSIAEVQPEVSDVAAVIDDAVRLRWSVDGRIQTLQTRRQFARPS